MTTSTGPQYLLTFGTSLGRTRTLRVSHADPSLTNAQVANAMQGIADCGMFENNVSGRIIAARRALFVETSVTPIEIFG